MIDRNKDILPQLQSLFPSMYDIYNENTVIYTLLSVYADKIRSKIDIIDRLNAMIGIQSTYDIDLERKWGNMLGIYKNVSESYNDYRIRLMLAYISLMGGTEKAIQYAIASVLNVIDSEDINKYIHVYDAWKYNGQVDINEMVNNGLISQEYGDIICLIDIACNENVTMSKDDIINAINIVKASGVSPQLLFLYTAIDEIVFDTNDNTCTKISEASAVEHASFSAYNMSEADDSGVFGYGLFGSSIFGSISIADSGSDVFTDKIIYIEEGGK